MTGLEQGLLTFIGLCIYLAIGVGSHKIQANSWVNTVIVFDVLFWPVDLFIAAFLIKIKD